MIPADFLFKRAALALALVMFVRSETAPFILWGPDAEGASVQRGEYVTVSENTHVTLLCNHDCSA
jgi:hypothetical protein